MKHLIRQPQSHVTKALPNNHSSHQPRDFNDQTPTPSRLLNHFSSQHQRRGSSNRLLSQHRRSQNPSHSATMHNHTPPSFHDHPGAAVNTGDMNRYYGKLPVTILHGLQESKGFHLTILMFTLAITTFFMFFIRALLERRSDNQRETRYSGNQDRHFGDQDGNFGN
ncbi:hypothetical protein B0J13DRAFT_136694 [Dactylonectria estremocensis]|uniref:Uncharacterized protein n=1 Tax=Dactylonectria estremocensis TaxID=1079267 RepID=A0A9P9DZR5_9HYPO|nr:hypothetical protein B0J13DRAFT_136694 [Dactylonectria estremocensis]